MTPDPCHALATRAIHGSTLTDAHGSPHLPLYNTITFAFATTADLLVAPEVVDAMLPFLREQFGNPSSSHDRGQFAKAAVTDARQQVAMPGPRPWARRSSPPPAGARGSRSF